jgi:hypothetical protein
MLWHWWARLRAAHADRRKSAPEDRAVWEQERRLQQQQQERDDIERRMQYLKADVRVWARKEL